MDHKNVTIGLVSAFALAAMGAQFVFTVKPSDMANVRRLGTLQHETPLGEGWHFKVPFIDQVDTMQVTLRTIHIPPFIVNTVDNQQVTLQMNFNYTVPANQVNRLLYKVGKVGGSEVDANIMRVARDRAVSVFATENTTLIPARLEQIQKEVTEEVFKEVKQQFGIDPHSLQFAQISPSDSFVASNENSVRAKNKALLEQNRERVKTAQAQQKVIASEGSAKAAIEEARGRTEANLIRAEANKYKAEQDGKGQAALTEVGIKVFGGTETYNEYLNARKEQQWNGVMPQVLVKDGSGVTTVVVPGSSQGPVNVQSAPVKALKP